MSYDHGLVSIKVNHHARCLHQRSFCSKVIVRTHTRTDTQTRETFWLHYLDHKVVGKYWPTKRN